MARMAVIREQDLDKGRAAFAQWRDAAESMLDDAGTQASATAFRLALKPNLPRPVWAMAVRYSLHLLERKAPGPGVEVRVAPWGAIKILDGPASDPHNLTPPRRYGCAWPQASPHGMRRKRPDASAPSASATT